MSKDSFDKVLLFDAYMTVVSWVAVAIGIALFADGALLQNRAICLAGNAVLVADLGLAFGMIMMWRKV